MHEFLSPKGRYLTLAQYSDILRRQKVLNDAYNGVTWFEDDFFTTRFRCAADVEFVEFLNETNIHWDWYTKNRNNIDKQKALFELVDMVHFMTAALLRSGSVDKIVDSVSLGMSEYFDDPEMFFCSPTGPNGNFLKEMHDRYGYFWNSVNELTLEQGLTEARANDQITRASLHLLTLIAEGISALGYSSDEFHKAYQMKNERNHQRIAGGVMRGVDVKANEKPLEIEA